jgi:WD40 repeat protein
MVTIDENGKTLIFEPEQDGVDMLLSRTQPRVMRIAEKQGFARMLGGYLWTSGGPGSGSASVVQANGTSAPSKGPVVRVHDVMVPGSAPRSLLPTENIGSITSGAVLRTHLHNVYLGHEGGFISIWNLATSGGTPECVEVVKVSTSDVLCLEGVNDRLWAGGRKGTITVYDIEHKPWTITNCWNAHSELPVHTLFVDPLSIEKCGQLTVVSVGRDEQAKFWDGLLGVEWIGEFILLEYTGIAHRVLRMRN